MKRDQKDTSKDNREGIVFTNPETGKEYTLTLSLGILQNLERNGKFNINELKDQLLSSPKKLFRVSFQAYHPAVSIPERNNMFDMLERYAITDELEDSDGEQMTLFDVLGEMLNEAIESINPSGNVSWRRVKKGK